MINLAGYLQDIVYFSAFQKLFKFYFVTAHYNKYWIWPRHTYFIKTYFSQTL